MDAEQTLQAVVELIEREPHGAGGADPVCPGQHPRVSEVGLPYLFKLDKLRDLDVEQRQLAYALIELMVAGEVGSEAWTRAKAVMDERVRRG
ncbi:hypothetical protein [endosymbiont of unidentified scaly snail isolate Monju]|uniref:hypothetical protein n=1 Tax=endosymbiont of unidentified scaly snail isolate Monju TaxID=1248727 RepID=UPI0005B7E0D2|nr:hypothetical protein [endosymbiont of unidentified scaly snail isolate Monju]